MAAAAGYSRLIRAEFANSPQDVIFIAHQINFEDNGLPKVPIFLFRDIELAHDEIKAKSDSTPYPFRPAQPRPWFMAVNYLFV